MIALDGRSVDTAIATRREDRRHDGHGDSTTITLYTLVIASLMLRREVGEIVGREHTFTIGSREFLRVRGP